MAIIKKDVIRLGRMKVTLRRLYGHVREMVGLGRKTLGNTP